VREGNAAPGECYAGDLQGGAINKTNAAIITRLCHGCGILSRTPICANCRHTEEKYSTRPLLDEDTP
jgi:hypothetical protein